MQNVLKRFEFDLPTDGLVKINADAPASDDPTRPHFEAKDQDEARHRNVAVSRHQQRILLQAASAAASILILLVSPVYWRGVVTAAGFSYGGDWPMAGAERAFAAMIGAQHGPVPTLLFGAVLAAPPLFVWMANWWMRFYYRFRRDQEWSLRAAEAESNEPRAAAFGYMGVFRLYARTKRRAVFALFSGLVWAAWSVVGVCALVFATGAASSAGALAAIFTVLGLTLTGSVVMTYLAYDISRRYVPGKILVLKTMIMAYRAATSQTNYADARLEAEKLQKELIEQKPWWFYSYRKAPKPSAIGPHSVG